MKKPRFWSIALCLAVVPLLAVSAFFARSSAPSTRPGPPTSALDDWQQPSEWTAKDEALCSEMPTRWMVIGWDGASWGLILPLMAEGHLPNLRRLMRAGSYATLQSFVPTLSPALWTTVATGQSPVRHGVTGFLRDPATPTTRALRLVGLGQPDRFTSSADRKSPALWDLFSAQGKTSLIVGYHNTYPAEPIQGAMISNYLFQGFFATLGAPAGNSDLATPELSVNASRIVHPPGLENEIAEIEAGVRDSVPAHLARFAKLSKQQLKELHEGLSSNTLSAANDPWAYHVSHAYTMDAFHGGVAERLYRRLSPELLMVHFHAVDIASHDFLYFERPDWYESAPATQRERLTTAGAPYRSTVQAFYNYLDEWLGRLDSLRDGRTGLLLLSDHGFEPEHGSVGGAHKNAPAGILVVQGPGILGANRLDTARLHDILPTVVASLGLPLAADLDGSVLRGAFCPARRAELKGAVVDTYGARRQGRQTQHSRPASVRASLEQQLRSLGYLE